MLLSKEYREEYRKTAAARKEQRCAYVVALLGLPAVVCGLRRQAYMCERDRRTAEPKEEAGKKILRIEPHSYSYTYR